MAGKVESKFLFYFILGKKLNQSCSTITLLLHINLADPVCLKLLLLGGPS